MIRLLRDTVDLQYFPGEGNDICGVAEKLERGRQVQTIGDDCEGAVPIDLHERAAVPLRRRTRRGAWHPRTLRERVEAVTAAKLHVNDKGGARGHLSGGGRLRPERHNLAVFG